MNREIKFRAWDMIDKVNRDVIDLKFKSDTYYTMLLKPTKSAPENWTLRNKDEIVLMQYTGLKDKNSKEIYEGDIVQLQEIICPITFDDGAFQMITDPQQGKSCAIQERLKRFEVIGNIYENPELLK